MARLTAPPMPTPEVAFKPYRTLVEQFPQAVPMLLWGTREQVTPVQVVPPQGWPAEASLGDLYAYTLEKVAAELGRPSWIICSAESWMQDVDQEGFDTYQHGDAEKAAKAGDPTVHEAVMIVAVGVTGEWTYLRRFTRTPHRVRWDEPETHDQALGFVADILKQVVR